jgi:UDP-glucose 4-epimerase
MTKRTALVLGAHGFIGRYAVAALRAAGWTVFGAGRAAALASESAYFAGDLRQRDHVGHILDSVRPGRIVFACGPASVQRSFEDPVGDFEAQMLPLVQVLDGARRAAHRPGVLLVSSAAVYGNPASIPVAESAPCQPISPYGFHKVQQEMLLDEFLALYGLPVCKARVFSTYGPGVRQLAVWDIAQRALKGDFTLHGTGRESRDYLHVADAGAALEKICSAAPFAGECINVASGVETPIEQLAALIYRATGAAGSPAFAGAAEPGKPMRWRADVSRLRALGFAPALPLEQGLRETVDWVRAHA